MIALNIKGDLGPLQKAFVDLRAKQVPFATALALTSLAKGVQADERADMSDTFDGVTPFTLNSVAVKPATKQSQVATVYPREIAEQYLAPYVFGGSRSYGNKKGMLVPKGVPVNQYGNLPKATLARLKGKPDVFIGSIRFRKTGRVVSGVWQRSATKRGERYKGGGEHGTRGDSQGKVHGVRTTLKLLIEFEDTTPVQKNFDFYGRANAYLRKHTKAEFGRAMQRALATARR